jgi:hypothetical protein
MIEVKDCKRGFILKGIENHKVVTVNGKKIKGHFIIFYDHLNGKDFIGAMITSSNNYAENLQMNENQFQEFDEFGNKCTVVYKESFLVPAKLHKIISMGPFELVGQLTEEGIDFVTKNIDNLPMVSWEEYNS